MKSRYRFDIKRMNADCEANYSRLSRLLPDLPELVAQARKVPDRTLAAGACDRVSRTLIVEIRSQQFATLHLSLVEQCRYTSTLEITVALPGAGADALLRKLSEFRMTVRLYHDVQLAEVVSTAGKRLAKASYSYPNESMFLPDEKAQQNRLLGEWLSLSLQNGLTSNTDIPARFAAGRVVNAVGGPLS